ncbi:MAG: NADH-quinone oxidoreductase subunit NuoF [Deltaproteobacteria bacterium]|nr:NADH-quinone oxidoreductase subunit NuoF [Deltaproteobacteria bacterium]
MSKFLSKQDLEEYRKKIINSRDPNKIIIALCGDTGCQAYGANKIADAFRKEIKAKNLQDRVELKITGCHGFCERGPLIVIYPKKIFYQKVSEKDVSEIISESVVNDNVIERLLYVHPETKEPIVKEDEVPFYNRQQKIISGMNSVIDPTNIDDYIAIGGYSALEKALFDMDPDSIIEEVKKANLRGRGGGGFPTGVKWESCKNAPGDIHYVICNADEGDPGAYMDRSLLEGNPHSVLEGMMIGAYAIGSSEGYVYVRNEYPLAVENVNIAIKQAREYGLLGENILGTDFSFDIKVTRGGGAFVCGESTALMASIEGLWGEPRAKHIHTVVSGLYNKPTNLNNVETWANVPLIINKGADWYSKIGTENSKGTKIFSLVGKVNNTGLVEVPMGITLREIIFDIGGGVPNGKKFKAVQTGGPSGGCIPEEYLDTPVDFDRLTELGSMMGSGGMIVMDESTCMVDVARYFLNFLKDESCGKCTTCREGIKRMYEILTDITEGRGKEGDIELLEELGWVVANASLCGLGQTAPNPVLSTIRYFRDEYEAHIKEKRCPAKVCKALIRYEIDQEKCTGCGRCRINCPVEAISGEKKKPHIIDQEKCIKCGICHEVCKFDAVNII